MTPKPHRETDLYFDKIIIGSSVEALTTAFKYGIPIFGDVNSKPLPHSYLPSQIDLSELQVPNEKEKFTYLSGKSEFRGMQRLKLWNILMHRLSISGLAPMYGDYKLEINDVSFAADKRKDGTELLKLYVKGRIVNIIVRERIIVFDYPKYENGNKLFMINDIIKLHNVYDLDENLYISQDCDFMNTMAYETLFYKRDKRMHNCCVKSIVSEKYINEWKYSAASIRLHIEKTIFWNIDKQIRISMDKREKKPMLYRICDSLTDIIEKDAMDGEVYD